MKTSRDPRHIRRETAIQSLFGWSFVPRQKPGDDLAKKIVTEKERIDKIIAEAAPEWPVEQINKIDLAILRLAVFELVIANQEPPKVVIDEAIELAKTYGGEKSPGFINGVLGTVFKKYLEGEKTSIGEK